MQVASVICVVWLCSHRWYLPAAWWLSCQWQCSYFAAATVTTESLSSHHIVIVSSRWLMEYDFCCAHTKDAKSILKYFHRTHSSVLKIRESWLMHCFIIFSSFSQTWLKPGGKLLISDYCCGELPHTEAFKSYVAQWKYNLCTPQQYGKVCMKEKKWGQRGVKV